MLIRFDFIHETDNEPSPRLLYFIRDDCFYSFEKNTSSHNIAELIFILNGTGNAILENHVYPLAENMFYIINPFVRHGEFLREGQGFTYFIAGVQNFSYHAAEGAEDGETSPTRPKKLSEKSRIRALFERIYRELSNENPRNREAAELYFRLLMIEIERSYKGKIEKSDSGYSQLVGEAKMFIDTHLYGDISPYFVSEYFGCLHNTLTKKFKKEVGISIQQYILYKRIEASKNNLINSSDSISKIASGIGFDNPSYFSRYFKKLVGCSPIDYRKNNRP